MIGGSISLVKNIVGICKNDIEPGEAFVAVAKDTATATAVGYGTGFVGATVKAYMQNSKSELMKNVSKTNLPGTIVTATITISKTMKKYFDGDIDGVQCLEELGEEGVGMIASSVFSAIGTVALDGAILGGLVGGMAGYALATATYGILKESLKEEKIAKERRIEVEKACEEHIKLLVEYRREIECIVSEYLCESTSVFRESFCGIKDALAVGDVDWVIENANNISMQFGGQVSFSNMEEFNQKMLAGDTFVL